ncbi:DUF3558 family protein [Corynebacterium sp. LK2514]|uniref:DUF3558 family protein n=1 Tax=Corynebacterium sp. LK2514 TaxID=3110473 RepID=UPI0034CEB671
MTLATAFLAGGCSGVGFSETGSELSAEDEHNTIGAEGAASEPADVASDAEPHSSNSESTKSLLPPLGEPDAMDPGFELFKPCQEITQEEFTEAGFGKPEEGYWGELVCSFVEGEERDVVVTLASQEFSPQNKEMKDEEVDGLYLETSEESAGNSCIAYLDTIGGTIVLVRTSLEKETTAQACEGAEVGIKGLAGLT